MTNQKQCPYCEGTGIRHIANGEDDYDAEYCDCPIGQKLQDQNEALNLQAEMFNFVNKQIGVK